LPEGDPARFLLSKQKPSVRKKTCKTRKSTASRSKGFDGRRRSLLIDYQRSRPFDRRESVSHNRILKPATAHHRRTCRSRRASAIDQRAYVRLYTLCTSNRARAQHSPRGYTGAPLIAILPPLRKHA
jgi:hypothetical protein